MNKDNDQLSKSEKQRRNGHQLHTWPRFQALKIDEYKTFVFCQIYSPVSKTDIRYKFSTLPFKRRFFVVKQALNKIKSIKTPTDPVFCNLVVSLIQTFPVFVINLIFALMYRGFHILNLQMIKKH